MGAAVIYNARDTGRTAQASSSAVICILMISVAFYLRQLDAGGAQTCLLRLAEELPQTRYRVRIYVQQPGGELCRRVPGHVRLISLNKTGTLRSLLPLIRSMRSEPPDILVSGLIHGNVAIVAAASCARGVSAVVTEHAPSRRLIRSYGGWRFRILPPLIRRAYHRADAVVAVSRGVRSELQELVPDIPVHVIANPVVPNNLAELANAQVDDPWLRQDGPPLLLGVGRLEANKRFDVLISAFARLAPDCPVGPREILAAGRYGKLVPVNDPAALDAAIRSALANPLPANLLIDRALDFSTSRSVTAYAELFESIVAQPQVRAKRRGGQSTPGGALGSKFRSNGA
jgi:glycosyltransferase involved in cell wall biosynthesis